jgi:hypothetical protein
MPILLIFFALLLVSSSVKGTTGDVAKMVREDIAPENGAGFGGWLLALLFVGALGYIKSIRPVADWLLGINALIAFVAPSQKSGKSIGEMVFSNVANFSRQLRG